MEWLISVSLLIAFVSVDVSRATSGVGQLEDISTPERLMEAQTYYDHVASVANEKNVTVSVLTISGTECRILELGQVADKTNGEVSRWRNCVAVEVSLCRWRELTQSI